MDYKRIADMVLFKVGKKIKEKINKKTYAEKVQEMEHIDKKVIYAPLSGQVIPLKEVNNSTFASEMLGKGVAIIPESGQVISPVDGKVAMLFPTKHAIGITTGSGVEILLHMGINTVTLEGEHFTANIESGSQIFKGQVLLEMDIDAVKAAGYDVTTPIIITNSDEYEHMEVLQTGHVTAGDALISLY